MQVCAGRLVWMSVLTTVLLHAEQVFSAGFRFVLLGENQASQWTEMDLNRGPPPSQLHTYSREEERCFEERRVYYRGRCRELLMRGPCPDGHWLVLQAVDRGLRPHCAPKLCRSDSAYWNHTAECIPLKDTTKCTKKQTSLQVDALGFGACKCVKGAARAMAVNGACYLLYSRGLCDEGYVVGVDRTADEFPAVCIPDVCRSTSPDKVLLPYKGSCYPEGSHEPCPEGQTLTVDVHSGFPSCSQDLINWNVIQVPPLCSQVDHNKNCRDRLTVRQESDNFILDLSTDVNKHNKMFSVSKG